MSEATPPPTQPPQPRGLVIPLATSSVASAVGGSAVTLALAQKLTADDIGKLIDKLGDAISRLGAPGIMAGAYVGCTLILARWFLLDRAKDRELQAERDERKAEREEAIAAELAVSNFIGQQIVAKGCAKWPDPPAAAPAAQTPSKGAP